MDINLLLRGLFIGFSIAAPVGPIAIITIRRTLAEGLTSGLLSGLGAATADGIYGVIAGFGVTFISNFLIGQEELFRFVGGIFLCYLGIKTYLSKPAEQKASVNRKRLFSSYFSTFLLTIANPMTILSFLAVFAGLGMGNARSYASAGVMALGVFLGSILWWFILTGIVNIFRKEQNRHILQWVNRISGLIIIGFGSIALLV